MEKGYWDAQKGTRGKRGGALIREDRRRVIQRGNEEKRKITLRMFKKI